MYSQFTIGAVGGINIANLSSNNVNGENEAPKTEAQTGEIAGLHFEYSLSERVSIYARPQYVMKGAKASGSEDAEISFGYFELPIGAKYLLLSGDLNPYIIGGAAFASLTSAEYSANGHTEDMKDNFYQTDLLLNIGAGVDCSVTERISLFFDARYSRSLIDLNKKADWEDYTSDIMLSVGLLVDL